MSGAGAARLVVDADLTVRVTDPQGRSATVRVDDHDGAVRVRVAGPADLAVIGGALPRLRVGARGVDRTVRGLLGETDGPRWEQDVELFLGRRLVLRRRAGRWRPGPAAVLPLALAGATVLTAAGVAVTVVVLLARRALRVGVRRGPGGGATG